MSNQRIEEIKERERMANPGPWVCDIDQSMISQAISDVVACVEQRIERHEWAEEDYANADFLGHSRDDVTYLLARIAELEAALAAAEQKNRVLAECIESTADEGMQFLRERNEAEKKLEAAEQERSILGQFMERAYAVMITPIVSGNGEFSGKVAILIYDSDPLNKDYICRRDMVPVGEVYQRLGELLAALSGQE